MKKSNSKKAPDRFFQIFLRKTNMKKHREPQKKTSIISSFINICLCAFYFFFLTTFIYGIYTGFTQPIEWHNNEDTPWMYRTKARDISYSFFVLISFSYLLFFGFRTRSEHPKRFRLILCAPILFLIFLLFEQIIFYPNFK